jgi:hypothetical protein
VANGMRLVVVALIFFAMSSQWSVRHRGRSVSKSQKVAAPKCDFRFAPDSGLYSDIGPCLFGADTVAKVENRTTPKISRKLIIGNLCCCSVP